METVTCGLCARVSDLDDAVDAGWAPCWWAPDPATGELTTDNRPACPACAKASLTDDGQFDGLVLREPVPMPDVVAGPWADRRPST